MINDIQLLLSETKILMKYYHILDVLLITDIQRQLFNTVKIRWGTRISYRMMGNYRPRQNLITISRSLMAVPEYVVKSVIWHELLHIRLKGHDRIFHRYDEIYPQYRQAKQFIKDLCNKLYLQAHPTAKLVTKNGKQYIQVQRQPQPQQHSFLDGFAKQIMWENTSDE